MQAERPAFRTVQASQKFVSSGVEWSDAINPQPIVDFQVGFTDPLNPEITLKTGNLGWIVSSEVVATSVPANIGSLSLDPSVSTDNFEVTLQNGRNAGAANVGSLDLTAAGWTGQSSLLGGRIEGNLTGNLVLRKSTSGGVLGGGFFIAGDVTGSISVPVVSGFFSVQGDFSGTFDVTEKLDGTILAFGGDVKPGARITVGSIEALSILTFSSPDGEFGGLFELDGVIEARSFVNFEGVLKSAAFVDMSGAMINGQLEVKHTESESRITVGTISGSGEIIFLPVIGGPQIQGNTTIGTIMKGGVLRVEDGVLEGDLVVTNSMAGQIGFSPGDLASTGTVQIEGDLSGLVAFDGTGSILSGNLDGTLTISGDVKSGGTIDANGDVVGSIVIEGRMDGSVDIAGSMLGSVTVGGALTSGRIVAQDNCDGAISVGEGTGMVSLIQIRDLGINGRIVINAGEGNFDAAGDIHIGATTWTQLPDVVFDGCIHIRDGLSGGGDLNGDISVIGCHATTDDLNICIDGAINGSVVLNQIVGCSSTADWSCVGACL